MPEQEPVELPLLALLHRADRWFSEALLARLAEADIQPITPAHMTVLAHLGQGTEQVTIAELARRAGVTRQTMHRAVTQLVGEGLLTTTPGPGFPRRTLVPAPPGGGRRRAAAAAILHDLERQLAERLGDNAVAVLRQTLTQPWPPA